MPISKSIFETVEAHLNEETAPALELARDLDAIRGDFLSALTSGASCFTDRLILCRISVGPSPQSEGANVQAGVKIPA